MPLRRYSLFLRHWPFFWCWPLVSVVACGLTTHDGFGLDGVGGTSSTSSGGSLGAGTVGGSTGIGAGPSVGGNSGAGFAGHATGGFAQGGFGAFAGNTELAGNGGDGFSEGGVGAHENGGQGAGGHETGGAGGEETGGQQAGGQETGGQAGAGGAPQCVYEVGTDLPGVVYGWGDAGIQFSVTEPARLEAFTFKNQGKADTITLRTASGEVVGTLSKAADLELSNTFAVDWDLEPGVTYRLTSAGLYNGKWHYFDTWPVENGLLSIHGGFGFKMIQNMYWFSFVELSVCPR
jgi:hypothetical protein